MTVQAMAAHLGLPDQTIYNICRLRGYQFKKHPEGRTYGFQHSKTRKEREIVEKPSSGKPPTQYSNTGYLALLQKYSD